MRLLRIAALALACVVAAVHGAADAETRLPYAGYVYPAGAQRGTVLRVTVGGQNLAGMEDAIVSGGGVRATLVRYEGGTRQLNGDQRRELRRRLDACRAVLRSSGGVVPPKTARDAGSAVTELPDVPILRELESLTAAELDRVEVRFLDNDPRRQPNVQISETAVFEIAVAADAEPGRRALRFRARLGVTNPVWFEVGDLPESVEVEPRVVEVPTTVSDRNVVVPRAVQLVRTPVVLNGQILPGDSDRWRFLAAEGQRLVIDARARRLVPFLADAVPGWFQATLSLADSAGREIAWSDDWRGGPDPLVFAEIPADGEYVLRIGDALARGREDFVYRVRIAEEPFVAGVFPLGAKQGTAAPAELTGWNIPGDSVRLDTAGGARVRDAARLVPGAAGGADYAVDASPSRLEREPNSGEDAERLSLPAVIDGRIAAPGDADEFRFEGHLGQEVVVDVEARRLGSPLDALVRLVDPSGAVFAWSDDAARGPAGEGTHDADPHLRAKLTRSGTWRVRLTDALRHGGADFAYRLRIGPPRPDFAVWVAPSSVNLQPGGSAALRIHVERRDGFDGAVALEIAESAGLALSGGRVPPGADSVHVTVTAAAGAPRGISPLRLVARGDISGATVVRDVVPSQDMMQAFLWRHLVPAPDMVVCVTGAQAPQVTAEVVGGGRLRIPAGGSARLRVAVPRRAAGLEVSFDLIDPPPGVQIRSVDERPREYELEIAASDGAAAAGNLVLEASWAPADPNADEATKRRRRVQSAVIPAVPVEVSSR